jgi:cholesterol 7-desaturase
LKDNTSSKKIAVNKAKRTRKIGEKIPPPFPNGWFAVASSRDVKRGESMSFDCLGENFVIFRSISNKVYVLDAYCPHMGANLGKNIIISILINKHEKKFSHLCVGGIVKDNCIECPFHQWKFSGIDGSLVDVPYSENFNERKFLIFV